MQSKVKRETAPHQRPLDEPGRPAYNGVLIGLLRLLFYVVTLLMLGAAVVYGLAGMKIRPAHSLERPFFRGQPTPFKILSQEERRGESSSRYFVRIRIL